jgi:hypothetical protein
MKKLYTFTFLFLSGLINSQITSCFNATPICANGSLISNTTGIPSEGNLSCLGATPNPKWYIFKSGLSGAIDLQLSQGNNSPSYNNQDVDFIMWGPFDHIPDCTSELSFINSSIPNNILDCSFSASAIESVNVSNAPSGKFYVIMSTNFSDQSGSILVQQTNQGQVGAGSLICDYVIISNQPTNRTYNVNGDISFTVNTLNASSYRWEMSIDGSNWTPLNDGGTMPAISGAFTNTLNLTNIPSTYNGYYFRVSAANSGDSVYSKVSQLTSTLSQSNFDSEIISVYYDKNSDAIVIQNNDETHAKFSYKLYDLNGRVVATGEIDSQVRNLSTSNYQSGVYLLEVFNQDKRLIKKIIKN